MITVACEDVQSIFLAGRWAELGEAGLINLSLGAAAGALGDTCAHLVCKSLSQPASQPSPPASSLQEKHLSQGEKWVIEMMEGELSLDLRDAAADGNGQTLQGFHHW